MRKVWYILGGLFLAAILVAGALPLWLPWALKPVAAKAGLEYSEYERIGYARFALNDVRFDEEVASFTGERIEGYLPLSWVRRVLTGTAGDRDFLSVENWRLELDLPEEVEVEEPEDVFAYEIYERVEGILPHVSRWVPRVSVRDGVVAVDPVEIAVDRVLWSQGEAEVVVAADFGGEHYELVLTGDVRDPAAILLEAELAPYRAGLTLALSRDEEALRIRGDAVWEKNHLVLSAAFGREDELPSLVEVHSESIEIPAELLKLDEYEAVTGTLMGRWENGGFEVDLRAEAAPRLPDSVHLPVEIDLRAEGNLDSVRLESAIIGSPWLRAELSEPLEADYTGRILSEESVLTVDADLSEQRFFEGQGVFSGRIGISPGAADMPEVDFRLNGEGLAAYDVSGESLSAAGRVFWTGESLDESEPGEFPWPNAFLEIGAAEIVAFDQVLKSLSAEASFVPPVLDLEGLEALLADGTALGGFIDYDVRENRIGRGEFALDLREAVVRDYLPEGVGFRSAQLRARVSGPLESVSHEVELALNSLKVPEVRQGDFSLAWSGEFLDFDEWRLNWTNDVGAVIAADGALEAGWPAERAVLDLGSLVFSQGGDVFLELESPARLEVGESDGEPDTGMPLEGWRVVLDRLSMEGMDQRVFLEGLIDWPRGGWLTLEADQFSPLFLTHYLEPEIPEITIDRLVFDSSWEDEDVLRFTLENQLSMEVDEGEHFEALVQIHGDGNGVSIETLELRDVSGVILTAEGLVPVALYPGRVQGFLEIDFEREFTFAAFSDPEATFWAKLDELAGIVLEVPELNADFSGTLARPEGSIGFRTERVEYVGAGEINLPRMEEVELRTVFDIEEARLEILRFLLEGQEVRADGRWPLGEEVWLALIQERTLPDWGQVEGRLLIDEAQLAPFARFAPELLAPQGSLSVDLAVRGDQFERGEIVLAGAATRPIMPFGSIHDMRARILFEGREAVLEEFSARLGGQQLLVSGRVEVPDTMEPDFEFTITGNNLPLTRQPGLVIRGDLDLLLRGSGDETPSITGGITMRESLVITDVRAMAPVSVATPERRPPFFSVDQEPFSEWTLDIDIRGDQFLAVRAPGFRGRLSANFNLRGTLLEPQSIGEVRIDAGAIRFPFATMRIQQGTISLSQDNPYRPQLFITASSRIFGYDLQMELSGTADDPSLEFTSHPPLSSEAILLMITAGELPRGELTFTGQQKATKLALYIAQNLFLEFGGDDDGAERLTIRSGENISDQGRETFYIEYMFHPRWGLVGEYDRFDAVNAGVKWRFFSR